ncbi:MAG TPA: hypothetical protein VLA28_04035 [Afifellaceae bacterium]|nr:hypothetical protein [Afifellaceae bacterium]
MIRMIVVPVLMLAFAGPAAAQSVVRDGRYAIVPVEDGFLRLDTGTGAVSRCTGKIDRLTCRILPDERLAYEAEIGRLEDRIDELESRVAVLEERRPFGSLDVPNGEGELPSEEEIDKVMTLAEKVMRRFFGFVKELKRDLDTDQL